MHKIFGFILILLSLIAAFLGSCQGKPSQHCAGFELADSLAKENPDSAIAILDSLDRLSDLTESDRMHSLLVRVAAEDNSLTTAKSDSTIKPLLEYYIDGDNDEELHPRVLYYAGRIYSDLGKSSEALRYFKQSLESLGKDNDLDLQSRIHAQMAHLFTKHRMFRHALNHTKKQVEYEKGSRDTIQIISSQLSLAFAFRCVGKNDSAELIYRKLSHESLVKDDSNLNLVFNSQLVSFMLENGRIREADSLISIMQPMEEKHVDPSVLNIANKVDWNRQDYDNIIKRSLRLLNNKNIYIRRQAARNLARANYEEDNLRDALYFMDKYNQISDSITAMESSSPLAEVEDMFNNAEIEAMSVRLKNEKDLNTFLIVAIVLFVTVVALLFIIHGNRVKLERARMINEIQLEAEKKLNEKENEMKELESSHNQLIEDIRLQKENMSAEKKQEEDINAHRIIDDAKIRLSKISYHFIDEGRKVKCKITDEDFVKLESLLSILYPRLITLMKNPAFKTRDRKDAMLTKIGISLKMCSNILNDSSSTLSNARNRLLKKLSDEGKIESDINNYSKFIHSL